MEEAGQYEYMRLVDAQMAVEQKINFYGVVTEYELPRPTNGKDMLCTMTVADMSCPGLRLLVFGSREQLPNVRCLHDIIRCHRVKMNVYKKAPQAVASKGSAFLLFDGSGNSFEPYQTSSSTFTFEEHDRKILDLMRAWSSTNLLTPVSSQYLLQIRDIKDISSYFDLCCKVVHVSTDYPMTMYVWDGTDASLTAALPFVESQSLPLSTLRQFPAKGTVLQVAFDVPYEDCGDISLPQAGNWVKLRNVTCRYAGGKLEAVFTRESKISMLPSDSQLVQDAESRYEQRFSLPYASLPENCPKPLISLTVTDYEHVPFSTLRELLSFPQVTYKFRCLVCVKSILPARVPDFCTCVDGKYVYRVQLTLEDPTAQIQAYLYGEDGERFFNGYPAACRGPDDSCLAALERSVERLLSGDAGDPPYMSCCIKSYYLDKQQPWTSRRFRIFGTRLI